MAEPGSGCAAVSVGRRYYRCFPPVRLVSSLRFAALAAGAATCQCPWAGTPSSPETPLCGLSKVPDVREPGHPRRGWAQPYPPVSASRGRLTRHRKLILSQRILDQQKCILSQSCRPEVQNQGVMRGCAPSAGSAGWLPTSSSLPAAVVLLSRLCVHPHTASPVHLYQTSLCVPLGGHLMAFRATQITQDELHPSRTLTTSFVIESNSHLSARRGPIHRNCD